MNSNLNSTYSIKFCSHLEIFPAEISRVVFLLGLQSTLIVVYGYSHQCDGGRTDEKPVSFETISVVRYQKLKFLIFFFFLKFLDFWILGPQSLPYPEKSSGGSPDLSMTRNYPQIHPYMPGYQLQVISGPKTQKNEQVSLMHEGFFSACNNM